jgi:hypothetical protein
MDDFEDALSREQRLMTHQVMTHQEILQRFKKLFGREMTDAERHTFFLPHQDASSRDE